MASAADIAAELREAILSGELTAGERLPSAREIARTNGVAIATASRVHALLRDEGLARSEPGVGTMVTASRASDGRRPGRSSPPRSVALNRIVTAGIDIADAEGLEAVTIRRVAHALRTVPKSLYRQVTGADDLELRMVDAALGEWNPGRWNAAWQERLLAGHLEIWAVFRAHPWLAQLVSVTRPKLVPAALKFAEWTLETLGQAGMSPEEAFETHIALFSHIRGIAILLEPEIDAESETGVDADSWIDARKGDLMGQVADGRHPALAGLTESGYALDVDSLVHRSLTLFIAGITSRR